MTVEPDAVRASRLGLRTDTISGALNLQFSGLEVTRFRDGDKSIPVVLRSREDFRDHPERLTDLTLEFLPASILRENALRVMTIKGRVNGRFASEALAEIQPIIAELMADELSNRVWWGA